MLLYFLTFIELLSFPLLGAGTASFFTDSILTVQGVLFGTIAGSLTMTLCTIRELWNPVGGAYNVDAVLQVGLGARAVNIVVDTGIIIVTLEW